MARPRSSATSVLVAIALSACGARPVTRPGEPSSGAGSADYPSVAAGWRPVPAAPDHRRGWDGDVAPPPVRYFVPAEPLLPLGTGGDLADLLLRLVGTRPDHATSLAFAFSALATLGLRLDPELTAVEDSPALRILAADRGALAPEADPAPPHLGDLLLFDRPTRGGPSPLVALAVGRDARGVVEFVYLARGVVRRGYLSRAHPTEKRDADGRILNTFLRHADGDLPPGSPALAGELFTGAIRLDRLLR